MILCIICNILKYTHLLLCTKLLFGGLYTMFSTPILAIKAAFFSVFALEEMTDFNIHTQPVFNVN